PSSGAIPSSSRTSREAPFNSGPEERSSGPLPFPPCFPEGLRVAARRRRWDGVRAARAAGARLGRAGRRSRSRCWPAGREKARAFNSGGPLGGTEALTFNWPGIRGAAEQRGDRMRRAPNGRDPTASTTGLEGHVLGEAKLAERHFRFLYLRHGGAARRLHIDRDGELEAAASCEAREDFGVEVHPLLRRDLTAPVKAGDLGARRRFRRARWRGRDTPQDARRGTLGPARGRSRSELCIAAGSRMGRSRGRRGRSLLGHVLLRALADD